MVAGQAAGTVPVTPLHFAWHSVVRSGLTQPIHEDTWGDFPSLLMQHPLQVSHEDLECQPNEE